MDKTGRWRVVDPREVCYITAIETRADTTKADALRLAAKAMGRQSLLTGTEPEKINKQVLLAMTQGLHITELPTPESSERPFVSISVPQSLVHHVSPLLEALGFVAAAAKEDNISFVRLGEVPDEQFAEWHNHLTARLANITWFERKNWPAIFGDR